MNCCLWIGGHKVNSVDELIKYFDIFSVRGYFLGGSLINWLISREEYKIAEILKHINSFEELDKQLYKAFGIVPEEKLTSEKSSVYSYEHKQKTPSFVNYSSFSYSTSYKTATIFQSSFRKSSFISTSFSQTSFYNTATSFIYESFLQSSFGSMSSDLSPLENNLKTGSYSYSTLCSFMEICPLNRYGYGIHIIK